MGEENVLSSTNWRNAIVAAIEGLPEDIKASVGYSHLSEDTMRVTVAGHPFDDDDGESFVGTIDVRWWNTLREQGWPSEQDSIYGCGGTLEERAGWPIVSIGRKSGSCDEGIHPGRAALNDLERAVQLAILEEMHEGGGGSLISVDAHGRFCRDDGQLILDWQAATD